MRTLYLSALFSLAMLFMVFGSVRLAHAEAVAKRSQLIIVADHSSSMHTSGAMSVQSNAIVAALDAFAGDCGNTTISYIAWGNAPLPPLRADLNDSEARYNLMLEISELATKDLGGTFYPPAMEMALALVVPGEKTVIVFLTDNIGNEYEADQIEFELHKVAVVRAGVALSLEEKFLPGRGTVHDVVTIDELTDVMSEIFESTRMFLCTG